MLDVQNTSLSPDFGPLSAVMAENPADRGNNFVTNETFHTPGFGEDDFDISALNFPAVSNNISHTDSQHFSQQQTVLTHPLLGSMDIVYGQNSPTTVSCAPLNTMETDVAPKFPPQNFDVPDISITNSLNSTSDSISCSVQSLYTMNGGHMDSMTSSHRQSLTTISHSEVSEQLGFQSATKSNSPDSNSTTSPSRESSEDSDDCLPLAQLALLKRQAPAPVEEPAPEVTTTTTTTTSKAKKTPKKKKKKDPNEPQKPVSAYALFFRDTQAAIKGQNPSATFGEVSKIVASMWDGLDPEHKSVYKKKTENAKKEYLKQLAAYRASLVSQAAIEDGSVLSDKPIMSRSMKQMNIQQQQQGNMSPQMVDNMGMMGHIAMNTSSPPHATSPLHHPSPPNHNMGYNSPPQQYPQSNLVNIAPRPAMGHEMDGDMDCNMMPTMCVRMGCTNAAIESPGWDNEYCSNECVVSHCRDVFTAWVSTRQGNNSFQVK